MDKVPRRGFCLEKVRERRKSSSHLEEGGLICPYTNAEKYCFVLAALHCNAVGRSGGFAFLRQPVSGSGSRDSSLDPDHSLAKPASYCEARLHFKHFVFANISTLPNLYLHRATGNATNYEVSAAPRRQQNSYSQGDPTTPPPTINISSYIVCASTASPTSIPCHIG